MEKQGIGIWFGGEGCGRFESKRVDCDTQVMLYYIRIYIYVYRILYTFL